MFAYLILILCAFAAVAQAQPFRWTTFTSTSSVQDMITVDGRIWTATAGGLAGFDPASGTFEVYTNTRGLAMNECTAIGRDIQGYVWVGHPNGSISRVHPTTGDVRQISDLSGEVFEITGIVDVGDEVFVSANNGVYRFFYADVAGNYRIRETRRVLGDFPGETAVTCLARAGDYLYAGTQLGLARAHTGSDSYVWENLTTANSGLRENNVRAMAGIERDGGLLAVATPGWVTVLRDTVAVRVDQRANLIALAPGPTDANWLIAATIDTVSELREGIWTVIRGGLTGITSLATAGTPAEIVVGLADTPAARGGIIVNPADDATPFRATGIGGNQISDLHVDANGVLWVGGASPNNGVYTWNGSTWTNYMRPQYNTPFFWTDVHSFAEDGQGGVWAGSQGGGAVWFRGDSVLNFHTTVSESFQEVNGQLVSRFSGFSGGSGYVETRVTANSAGYVYISQLEPARDDVILQVSPEWIARGNNRDPWLYPALPDSTDISTDAFKRVQLLIVDPFNRLWMGASRNGTVTVVMDPDGTPNNLSDDDWYQYRPQNNQDAVTCYRVLGDEVLSWDIDSQGYLWIGTTNGAYYTQGGMPQIPSAVRLTCVIDIPLGTRVNAVHVDANDNKWFGTDDGVVVIDKNFNHIHTFRSASSAEDRSDLISNSVTAIASNARTGEVWIGTSDGLSLLQSPYISAGGDLRDLKVYPNPFVADGEHRMFIDHRELGGRFDEMRIFTLSGRLVRKMMWSEAINPSQGWDGRNDEGELVAGGVYLVLVSSNEGQSATGKVAVLGR